MQLFQQNYDLQTKVAELQHLAEMNRKPCINNEKEIHVYEISEKREFEQQIKCLKLELANSIATNVEYDEAIRETNIKLVAAQELYKNSSAEIAAFKVKNGSLQIDLDKAKAQAVEFRDNVKVIQAQVN